MPIVVDITATEIAPTIEEILVHQGVPPGVAIDEATLAPARQASDLLARLSRPTGAYALTTSDQFASVYGGSGRNDEDTPLEDIYKRADALALFAATIGGEVEREIRRLFEINEFPLGSMLDAAASVSAEKAVDIVQDRFQRDLADERHWISTMGVMPFSPGYCGWHVSGQRALFDVLHPERIGIELSESCLMQPLKSISGVFVAGAKEIFEFDDDFVFCSDCATRSCRDRIKAILENQPKADTR
jgi:hypothetical protein